MNSDKILKYTQLFKSVHLELEQHHIDYGYYINKNNLAVRYYNNGISILIGNVFNVGIYCRIYTVRLNPSNPSTGTMSTLVSFDILEVKSFMTEVKLNLTVEEFQEMYIQERFFQYSTIYDMSPILYFMDTIKNLPDFIKRISEIHAGY